MSLRDSNVHSGYHSKQGIANTPALVIYGCVIHMYVCMYMCVYACMYVCMYIYVDMCVCVCVFMHDICVC
jgi:hypothetical protein